MSQQLVQEKVKQAKDLLNEFDIDCWITFVRESAINGDPTLSFLATSDVTWHSAFIICRDGTSHAIVGKYDKMTVEQTGAYDEVTGFVEGIKQPLTAYLKNKNPNKIAINYSKGSEICDGLTYGMYLTLYEILAEAGLEDRLISAQKIVSALRERKTSIEIEYISEAILQTEDIWKKLSVFIKPGMAEKEIAAFVHSEIKNKGLVCAWEPNVCPSVFTGPDGGEAHYAPTDRIVERGHILNMDFGVKFNEYCSDMQRTFYILDEGETKPPADVQRGFDTIVDSIENAKQNIQIGIEAYQIDKVARDIITNAGYDEFPHGLGHQVGRFAHDGTALLGPLWEKYADKPMKKLEKNMVFTIEPRLTVPDRGIATIEEMIVVKENGAQWLTTPQKEIILIK